MWVVDGVSENSLSPSRSRPWVVSDIRFGRGVIGGDGGCEVEVPVSTGCAWGVEGPPRSDNGLGRDSAS